MPTTNKTTETSADVTAFLSSFVDSEQKKQDSLRLIKLMQKWSGYKPKIWGSTIIGFGKYHYQYSSGHEGDMPLMGFSPRKAAFSLYVTDPGRDNTKLLARLGNYTMGKSCIYFKKLSDLNLSVLEKLSKENMQYVLKKYKVRPGASKKGSSGRQKTR